MGRCIHCVDFESGEDTNRSPRETAARHDQTVVVDSEASFEPLSSSDGNGEKPGFCALKALFMRVNGGQCEK